MAKLTCGFPPCRTALGAVNGNAVYCSALCKNRAGRLLRLGTIRLACPRCGRREYIWTLHDGDCCLACGYVSGNEVSLGDRWVLPSKGGRYYQE